MLNKEKHALIMGQILKDIYSDIFLASLLGFKGGTCVYFFYDLPRFSVDLDFDLLSFEENKRQEVFIKIKNILVKYGQIKDSHIKENTIFYLLSYGDNDHNIKIEISTRDLIKNIKDFYELKEHLGTSLFIAKKDYMFSSKLVALIGRNNIAMRDVYDIYFFAKNNWVINSEIILLWTTKSIGEYLSDCIKTIEKIKENEILAGLGELVNEKEKKWIKESLREEVIFLLKNYKFTLQKTNI
ncbi:nucleotidyl transferase AbiEii/AbiGii toxin family protein [Patescibacteria group bacterium]|nr:nucleotidyl transferase AbiEii/AbiGii toxin family protein [Patescibacteria group bacterium]